MKLLFLPLIVLLPAFTIAQATTLSINQIDSMVAAIDSTKGLNTFISEGSVMRKGTHKIIGGFSDYFYSNNSKVLLKVTNSFSAYTVEETDYYFHHDSLIFVRAVIHKTPRSPNKEITTGQYYFQNGVLIYKQERGKPYTRPEIFWKLAETYIADAKSNL